MKRVRTLQQATLFCLLLAATTQAQETDSTQTQGRQPPAQADNVQESREAVGRYQEHSGARARVRVRPTSPHEQLRRLPKLQELMHEHLDLSAMQKAQIDRMIEEHLAAVRLSLDRSAMAEDRSERMEELRAMQRELREAKRANNRRRAREIRDQMKTAMSSVQPAQAPPLQHLFTGIERSLDAEKARRFREVAERVGLAYGGRDEFEMLRSYMRAVLDPDLGLSAEQRREVREFLRDALTGSRRGDRSTSSGRMPMQQIRDRIDEMLTPEQRAIVAGRIDAQHGAADRQALRNQAVETKADEISADEAPVQDTKPINEPEKPVEPPPPPAEKPEPPAPEEEKPESESEGGAGSDEGTF